VRIYYASDLHASDVLWRKFLNAGPFYHADVLVMGGDMCGKALIPIVSNADGTYQSTFMGRERKIKKPGQLAALEADIRFNGMYPYVCSASDVDAMAKDEALMMSVFEQQMAETFRHWLQLAEEKLAKSRVPCFVMPGNDDPWILDSVFSDSGLCQNCNGRVLDLAGGYTLVSVGESNHTPWDTPRELTEEELEARIRETANGVDPRRSVFNLHVPPYDSGLDYAPLLSADLKPQTRGGQTIMVPVGSTAVRKVIEDIQPLLTMHGHIHESKGRVDIGKTVCVNPGSRYNMGWLDGVLLDLEGGAVTRCELVSG